MIASLSLNVGFPFFRRGRRLRRLLLLLLLPDIIPAQPPNGEAHEHRQPSGEIVYPVKTGRVCADDSAYLVRRHDLAERCCAGGEDGLGVYAGSFGLDLGDETVVEDGVGDADEDGAAEALHEDQNGHDECDFRVGEDGLKGDHSL